MELGNESEKQIGSWDDFKSLVSLIRGRYGFHQFEASSGKKYTQRNTVLFRGQADAAWGLSTTLERRSPQRMSFRSYLDISKKHLNEMQSLLGRVFTLPESFTAEERDSWRPQLDPQTYSYLVYLRHHGFPSPLLDWTESPYVAAFFALRERNADGAVFAYIDHPRGTKSAWEGEPKINVWGNNVTTHPRHFVQQAQYTTATQWENGGHYFCSHNNIVNKRDHQEILVKLVLPATLRRDALRELTDFNITEYTLFQTEDALIHSIASKVFDLSED